ncbi:MAG: Rid family detoxifying hydrolase [Gammaproteobacteria bacterium]|nr:Rid family detoxifying hydrolase [Gammaproteobacteria bacterium]
MAKTQISTSGAPQAIGTYSQAVVHKDTVYISGQIPLVPETMELVSQDIAPQIEQVFSNLKNICESVGGDLNSVLKFTVYLTNLDHFGAVNAVMESCLDKPYPARAAIEVSALPKGALVEVDAIMSL